MVGCTDFKQRMEVDQHDDNDVGIESMKRLPSSKVSFEELNMVEEIPFDRKVLRLDLSIIFVS